MYIKVRVTAGAKKDALRVRSPRTLDISVRQPAQRGQANTRVRECMAAYYQVPVSSVRIISGHHRPVKMCAVETEVT